MPCYQCRKAEFDRGFHAIFWKPIANQPFEMRTLSGRDADQFAHSLAAAVAIGTMNREWGLKAVMVLLVLLFSAAIYPMAMSHGIQVRRMIRATR